MKKSLLLFSLATVLSSTLAMAVPAKPGLFVVRQPDGTTVTVRKVGDERGHMTLTADGRPVMRDQSGYYRYATLDAAGAVQISDIKAADLSAMDEDQRAEVERIDAKAVRSAMASARTGSRYNAPSRLPAQGGVGLTDDAFLGRSELNGLVILAQFSDKSFADGDDRAYFLEMLNLEGFSRHGGTGSARDYFIDSSSGQFTPTFDVYGPVTLSHPYAYYGANNYFGEDVRAAEMIAEACTLLDSEIDFSQYDLDGDGKVDNVFVFYAGYGEASYDDEDTVWPHQWELASAGVECVLDGVTINKYACSNELELDSQDNPVPGGIGTFVHEFSHVLGLPDLYVTSGEGYWTPMYWSVLDAGPYNNDGRTPPAYSIYERNALGWIDPIVIDGSESISLEAINISNKGCLIPTSKDTEFFLIENRQQTGWDKYLPGHGMLVWHIDYDGSAWHDNIVNNSESHQYVDLEEARGSYADIYDYIVNNIYLDYDAYYDALAAYAFPGSGNVTSFTDNTTPSMRTWAGASLGLPITDIYEADGVVTFNVAGGRCDAAVPVTEAASDVTGSSFVARWQPSEGATDYLLTVSAEVDHGEEQTVTADFGSGSTATLPEGWSFVDCTGDPYTSLGNYGESSPSFKVRVDGTGLMTADFGCDVKSIGFWCKGMSTNDKSKVVVSGKSGEKWTVIEEITPTNNKATTHKIENVPEGITQVKITYTKGNGNLALDDVSVTYGGIGVKTLADYDALSVGTVTSYLVDKLLTGSTKYFYKVQAVDAAGRRSASSDLREVDLDGSTGIEAIGADTTASYVLEGLTAVYSGAEGDRVSIFAVNGGTVAAATAGADGTARLVLPGTGVYMLVSPRLTAKLLAR